ncbi:MAG: class I SAM-dependent methyltransferase [Planctomycetota bacterium]|nr:class I SAM-dependent methyltransferase [Planctomycetota bacterium]
MPQAELETETKREWERLAALWTRQADNPNDKFTKLVHNVARLIDRHVPPGRSLDTGCGPGLLCQLLLRQGFDVYGTDIAENMIRAAMERLAPAMPDAASRFRVCVGDNIPFDDMRFNLITAIQVFPYIPNYTACIQRLSTRLEPGGFIVASSTNRLSLFVMHEILHRLLRLPPHLRTIRNLILTGYHSGGNMDFWKAEQAYCATHFDRLFAAQRFRIIDSMDYYHIHRLDEDPLDRRGWNRRWARRLAWYHVGVYQKPADGAASAPAGPRSDKP